jgi:hypothetical protein
MYEYGDDWLGCGHADHDSDCLCDVVLDENRSRTWIGDAVNDVYMGSQICEIRGYGVPWTRDSLVDYLCDLRTFNDALIAQNKTFDFQYQSLYDVDEIPDSVSGLVRYSLISNNVLKCMERFNYPLTYVLRKLNVSAEEFVASATRNKCRSGWTYEQLDSLEEDMTNENVSYPSIAIKYSITFACVKGLRKYWGSRRTSWHSGDNEAQQYMHKLCLTTDMTPKQICDEVYNKYNFLFARSAISKFRSRHRKKVKDRL